MRLLAALGVLVLAGSPALADDCPSAKALEQRLAQATVTPFVGRIEAAKPDPGWKVEPSPGGFVIPAPPLGEILSLREATATTSCGLKISWQVRWQGAHINSAGQFKVAETSDELTPRTSQTFRSATFRITPDKASQTAWLSVTDGGRTDDYRVNFPATAITVYPIMHVDVAWVHLVGVRADGALVYAEFNAAPPR